MVHVFERAGLLLALDVGSGAVHVLDDAAYKVLESAAPEEFLRDVLSSATIKILKGQGLSDDVIGHTFAELCSLAGEGLLFSDDSYAEFAGQLGEAPVKAMCLHMAHDCNLRCRYCFASTGEFNGTRKLMPLAVAQKAIDRLIAESGTRRNLEVDFFGGEPLMNFGVVKDTVIYARQREAETGKTFRFTITTNGLMLSDDVIDYINQEMGNVVLSIDGRKEVNDAMRPKIDGSGSFDAIVPRYQKLVQTRGNKEYYVRGTYTRDNLDFDKDVLALHELGFNQISVEPVVGPETDDYTIREKDVPAIEAAYERLVQEMLHRRQERKGEFNFFHFMLDLDNGPCAIKRLKGCGCGNEYLAVTPDGELYPCHQFVGQEGFQMGTVEEGVTQTALRAQFAKADLLHKDACQNCWAKLFCSGGCNANNQNYCGSLTIPHEISCQLEKIRLECAIALKAVQAMENKETVTR